MTAAVKDLVEEALHLAPEEREELVETLLSHQEPDEGWAQAWEEEISRRMEDIRRTGKAKLIPAEEVFRRMDAAAAGRSGL